MKITKLLLAVSLLLIVAGCKPSENENGNDPSANTNAPAMTNSPSTTNK